MRKQYNSTKVDYNNLSKQSKDKDVEPEKPVFSKYTNYSNVPNKNIEKVEMPINISNGSFMRIVQDYRDKGFTLAGLRGKGSGNMQCATFFRS